MDLLKNKRGVAFVWISALVIIFTVGLLYTTMTRPFEQVYDLVEPMVNDTDYTNTFTQIHTYWKVWPILVILGITLWAFLSSMRRDPNEYSKY